MSEAADANGFFSCLGMIWHRNCCVKDPFGTVGCRRRPGRDGGRPDNYKGRIAVNELFNYFNLMSGLTLRWAPGA
jgi:hypothetical protein